MAIGASTNITTNNRKPTPEVGEPCIVGLDYTALIIVQRL